MKKTAPGYRGRAPTGSMTFANTIRHGSGCLLQRCNAWPVAVAEDKAESVVLDLIGPLRAGRHDASERRQARLNEAGRVPDRARITPAHGSRHTLSNEASANRHRAEKKDSRLRSRGRRVAEGLSGLTLG
jgi:hypothetical protein